MLWAIINPWLDPDIRAPSCGMRVAFKLAEALAEAATGSRALPHRFVDLVAVGTVADVVPLLGENRSTGESRPGQDQRQSRDPGAFGLAGGLRSSPPT